MAHDVKMYSASYKIAMKSQNGGISTKPDEEATEHSTSKRPSKRSTSPSSFRKPCDLCHEPNDVLVRCQIDDTMTWHFVCPSKCWKGVSGGVIDGGLDHPCYVYGGMWKNKHALVSAKKRKHKKKGNISEVKGQASSLKDQTEV